MEHLLYLISSLHENYVQVDYCNYSSEHFFELYFKDQNKGIFVFLPYHWTEIFIIEVLAAKFSDIWRSQNSFINFFQWLNVLMAFSWNFVDLFIITISVGLNMRFQQINDRLHFTSKWNESYQFWKEIRIHFFSLCDLLEFVDSHISILIFISTGHNMYSLCSCIFYSFSWGEIWGFDLVTKF